MSTIVDTSHREITDAPIVRTLLYNLIIISSSTSKQAYFIETANQIASEIPGRIIMLTPDMDEEAPASRLFCNIATDGKRTFCGEVVTLNINTDPESLPGQVFPLIAPDLPVYVWSDIIADSGTGFEWLSTVADIHIINSCTSSTDACLSANALDMTWLQLDAWMKAIIRAFDNSDVLDKIHELVEITIDTDSGNPDTLNANPVLLAAWIVDCLDPESVLTRQSENAPLSLLIDGRTILLTHGFTNTYSNIKSITFKFSGQRGMQEIIVEQESDNLRISSKPEDLMQYMSPEPVMSDGLLLARELGDEAMLHKYSAIAKLAAKIGLI